MTRSAHWAASALLIAVGLWHMTGTAALAFSGSDLLERCSEASSERNRAYCEGYLESLLAAGNAEMIYLRSGCSTSKCRVGTSDKGRGQLFGREWCLPEHMIGSDLLDPLTQKLGADIILRQAPAPRVVVEFLSESWPCGK